MTCVGRRYDVQKNKMAADQRLHFSDKNPVFYIVTTENTSHGCSLECVR